MTPQPSTRPLHSIGLMSGTSLDGIDAALLTTDGERVQALGPALTLPYTQDFRDRLRALLGRAPEPSWQGVIDELTDRHADAVLRLLDAAGLAAGSIDVVGFHGQTVLHRPQRRQTVQIGDPQRLADRLGIPVVGDLRQADVAAGGQGAPLVPLYHAALAEPLDKPLVVLNIGGVANLTWIGEEIGERIDGAIGGAIGGADEPRLLAFDTGPGNALIDDFVHARTGGAYDEDGGLAAAGRADGARVMAWLRHDFFRRPWPKSLDRDDFAFATSAVSGLSTQDGAATLAAFTARAVVLALPLLPAPPRRILVCGGGRRNPVLLRMIADGCGLPVERVETVGWRGDSIEAEAFAFLAVRSLRGLPLTLPSTTGVPTPLGGGLLYRPAGR